LSGKVALKNTIYRFSDTIEVKERKEEKGRKGAWKEEREDMFHEAW
jgi:hypothetical protein